MAGYVDETPGRMTQVVRFKSTTGDAGPQGPDAHCAGGASECVETDSGDDAGDASDGAEDQQDATMGAGEASSTADAEDEPVYLESGAHDAMIPVCTAPLPDAGFSTLADLPISKLCASSNGDLIEYGPACQGSILVAIPGNPSTWWLFSASTGQLEASGSGDDGSVSCTGGVSGFQLPYQCFWNGGWPEETNLCVDGATPDGGAVDASAEAGD